MKFECRKGLMPHQRDVICDKEGELKIQVFNLREELFHSQESEVHLFGDNFGDILAFETINYHNQSEHLIRDAIMWYAQYLGNPQMEIFKDNPIF